MNNSKANDNLETEETGANADDTSDKNTRRKKGKKEMKKPVKIPWYPQIFRNNTLWPLSSCFPPQA